VGQDESRLVLASEIATQLKRAVALGAIGENRDGEQVVADRPLAVREDRPSRDRELMAAAFAFPHGAGRQFANVEATAARAIGRAAVVGPADALKRGRRLIVRHTRHGAQRERPGGCGEKEVLGHVSTKSDVLHHRI